MRTPFSAAPRGSQKWLQVLINDYPAQFAEAIGASGPGMTVRPIEWVSPLRTDEYAEYRDTAFLQQFGLGEHAAALKEFWPTGGPQWDGLGHDGQQTVYLVEAKAHVNELGSTCKAKSPRSLTQIDHAFRRTQSWLNVAAAGDWKIGFYQQANRLAHLYFLREVTSVDAYLVNVYFVHDDTLISTSQGAWDTALAFQRQYLGVGGQLYKGTVIDVFLDVRDLTDMPVY